MKFPKGKKERMQIFAFIGIAAVGAVYALVTYLIVPQRQAYKACRAAIEVATTNLTAATAEVRSEQPLRDECDRLRTELREIDAKYILKEEFGNYDIKAREEIDRLLASVGLKLDGAPSGQRTASPNPIKNSRLNQFIVQMSCTLEGIDAYEKLKTLFHTVEAENPYVFISRVTMTANNLDPLKQTVSFAISWPIWENPAESKDFMPRLEDIPAAGTSAPTGRKRGKP